MKKNKLRLKNVISKMFKNHMYNYMTMWKQIADVGLNLLVLCSSAWSCLCVGRWALVCLECYLLSICLEILGLTCV